MDANMTILPMLATPTSGASNRTPVVFEQLMEGRHWAADVKIDGVRALVHWDGAAVKITNRVATDITHRYPELVDVLTDVLGARPAMVIDGEIVARDGSFETTLMRDQQVNRHRISVLAVKHPAAFVAFDLPEFGVPWEARRFKLDMLASDWNTESLTTTVTSTSPDFLAQTRELKLEGVVAKLINGRYEFGKRSKSWLKFRNRYRVSCLVAGYTPGTGSRSHFGAMELALLGPDGPVSVGRVGTGFDEREIARLKERLDAGDLLVVEIETTNQTSGGQLRFPVYRGVRTDVQPRDCTIEQLTLLPTC